MKTIHKIMLPLNMGQHIQYTMPFNSRILSCAFQYNEVVLDFGLFVWFITDAEMIKTEQRNFYVIETGSDIPQGIERINFIGTAQRPRCINSKKYVIHLFEGEIQ